MYKVLTLNNISVKGLERLPREAYEIASEIQHPDAILLRSFKMHEMEIPASLKCVGRAGAGVNNIPVDKMSDLGIPVFNAPGANANAVKELVIAGMLLSARNICPAWDYVNNLRGSDSEISKQVEQGKKDFAGSELYGRTLGVIGLGAIGRLVANDAINLGMNVIGFDPGITVQGAWQLSSSVQQASSVEELLGKVDFVTFHVPLIDATRNMINAERISLMKPGATILNFARGGIVEEDAVITALQTGKLKHYVNDFPSQTTIGKPGVIDLPHLGASTAEAEDNCAVMVAEQIRDYLENGNIVNSVNFPKVRMHREPGGHRLTIANRNVPNMVGQITTQLAERNINIVDLFNKSRNELAYTLIDVDQEVPEELLTAIESIDGVLNVRQLS
jgi:D-3-phosphoglycerate dehydrogenase